MKAIAVKPGIADSVHLVEMPKPSVHDVSNGRGVLVKVLRVGVDGTDKEINNAEYGAAPAGDDFLVIGHEGFGVVEEIGANVTELNVGDYVVATVRRPGTSIYDVIGTNDMTTDETYYERGINLRHGYLAEYYADDAEWIGRRWDSLHADDNAARITYRTLYAELHKRGKSHLIPRRSAKEDFADDDKDRPFTVGYQSKEEGSVIDELTVYRRPLTAEEIRRLWKESK